MLNIFLFFVETNVFHASKEKLKNNKNAHKFLPQYSNNFDWYNRLNYILIE